MIKLSVAYNTLLPFPDIYKYKFKIYTNKNLYPTRNNYQINFNSKKLT